MSTRYLRGAREVAAFLDHKLGLGAIYHAARTGQLRVHRIGLGTQRRSWITTPELVAAWLSAPDAPGHPMTLGDTRRTGVRGEDAADLRLGRAQ